MATTSKAVVTGTGSTTTETVCSSSMPIGTTTTRAGYGMDKTLELIIVVHYEQYTSHCDRLEYCTSGKPTLNPDISGIGVLSAFMVTAWLLFVLSVAAYILGLLPPELITTTDTLYFGADSRNHMSPWKTTMNEIVLVLSDQQLILGLALLIAGYYAAFAQDLDTYHWKLITYMAWLSANVHLMSISLIRHRFRDGKLLRVVRITAMVLLFSLLLVALHPPIKADGMKHFRKDVNSPTRYFLRCYHAPDGWTEGSNAFVAYSTLVGVYTWKFGQLFKDKLPPARRVVRSFVHSFLQRQAIRVHDAQRTARRPTLSGVIYKVSILLYVSVLIWVKVFESYMATLLALLFSLTWGTMRLLGTRSNEGPSNNIWSFGQILPILLLLHPVMAAISASQDLLAEPLMIIRSVANGVWRIVGSLQRCVRTKPSTSPCSGKVEYDTLSQLLRHEPVPRTSLGATKMHEVIAGHLHTSRSFRGLVYILFVTLVLVSGTVLFWLQFAANPGMWVILTVAMEIVLMPILVLLTWPWSKKLH